MTEPSDGASQKLVKLRRVLGIGRRSAGAPAPNLPEIIKEGISLLAGIATIIGVAGAIVAVLEYTGQGEAERAAASLQLVDAWEDDGYRASFERLSADLASAISRMPSAELSAFQSASPDEQSLVLTGFGDEYLATNGEKGVDKLFYFFTKLSVCVSANLCSAHAIDAFFGDPITTFWTYFAGYAERRRALYPAFAEDVELYATRK